MQNWKEIKTVYIKEITEILRNKRVIISAFLIPLLIYPIIIGGMDWLQGLEHKKISEEGFRIAIAPGHDEVVSFLKEKLSVPVHVIEIADVIIPVMSKDADMGIQIDGQPGTVRNIWFLFLGSNDSSIKAMTQCKEAFENNRFFWIRNFLADDLADIRIRDLQPFDASFHDVASVLDQSGHKIAKILPFILILMLVSGCSFAAVDLIAGEKERGCFETLLVSPINRQSVIIGKMLVVIVTGFISLIFNLISMFLCLKLGLFTPPDGASFTFLISYGSITGVFLCALPMTIIFASTLMLISAKAKTYQAGQTLLMPFSLLALLPAVTAMLPGMHSDSFIVAVPIANVVVAMKEMLEGTLKWWPMVVGNLVNLGLALAILRITVTSLEKEGSLVPGSVSDTDFSLKGIRKDPVIAAFTGFTVVWLLMFYVMAPLQAHDMVSGLLITLWGLILCSAIVIVRFQKLPLKKTLSLRSAPWYVWIGAFFFQLGVLPTTLLINKWLLKLLPVPEGWMDTFSDALTPEISSLSLVLLMAVSPGICEELLFRGAIFGSLRQKWSPWRALIATSILFGLLHFSVYRLVPTTLIGLGLGWIVYISGSIYPAMLAHALNNAIAIVFLPELPIDTLSQSWFLVGIPLLFAGAIMILRGSKAKENKR
ncbi:CPBP family intramembrane metalloprotease [bacterium]|nr:CPBP family intramembrane metalloprotease [candidate division CSSED10-310 bacterium]